MTTQSDDYNYPFPPKHHVGYWGSAPMTYDEAVQAFHSQSEKDQLMMKNPVKASSSAAQSHDLPFPPKTSMFWENNTSYNVGYDEAANMFSSQDATRLLMMNSPLKSQAAQALAQKQQAVRDRILQAKEEQLSRNNWQPIQAEYPVLVYETQRQMDDESAPDMLFGDESKQKIQSYGYKKPFRDRYGRRGTKTYLLPGGNQFSLPVEEHFSRMRSLGTLFSWLGETDGIYDEMVDKFQTNEGGHYTNPLLDNALKNHETTKNFHNKLKQILTSHVFNNQHTITESITTESSLELSNTNTGVSLPKFSARDDFVNGTVITVHDIWAVKVYADNLEYRNNQIRGRLLYEIQDHFGLDRLDINHPDPEGNWLLRYESLAGFRSWYILQHYEEYGFKPFFTDINFTLELK